MLTTPIVSHKPNDLFFFNQKLLHEYYKKNSESTKESVPGSFFFLKLLTFWDIHYKRGELFMEYQKASCLEVSEKLCSHCKWNYWMGPKCNRISKSIPDLKNRMHYLSTSLVDGKGRNRETDNWQPSVQITKVFNEGLISFENKRGNI